jgi:hypothetical protein
VRSYSLIQLLMNESILSIPRLGAVRSPQLTVCLSIAASGMTTRVGLY